MFCGINGPIQATIRSIITAKGEQELGKGEMVLFSFSSKLHCISHLNIKSNLDRINKL
jgi:hypothetical protein